LKVSILVWDPRAQEGLSTDGRGSRLPQDNPRDLIGKR